MMSLAQIQNSYNERSCNDALSMKLNIYQTPNRYLIRYSPLRIIGVGVRRYGLNLQLQLCLSANASMYYHYLLPCLSIDQKIQKYFTFDA